ncbi:MAG: sigma 54-interacting transcriptional regulator [Planctomycetes bacterium]|nr:sigma 54-interacting transcriptional regulator [Planctomycetota bacterium]
MEAIFRIVAGPGAGKEFRLAEGVHACGRDAGNAIALDDPAASRVHFELCLSAEGVVLVDRGSRNATLVNGDPVREWRLSPGDRIGAGATVLEYVGVPEARAGESPGRTTIVCSLAPGTDFLARLRARPIPEEFARTRRDLALLCDFAAAAAGAASSEDLLSGLLASALSIPGAERAWFLAWDATKGAFSIAAASAHGEGPKEKGPSQTLARQVKEGRSSLLVLDAVADPAFAGAASLAGARVRSAMGVPLAPRERFLGVLEVTAAQGGVFDEEDLRLASALAHQAALALDSLSHVEELSRENALLRERVRAGSRILGESAGIRRVLSSIEKVAPLPSTILVRGESGTGKELVAQAIHQASPRSGRPFVSLNCAALPEGLLESELFGHEKGAFTGADRMRAGRFEQAHGGTLFLDEVGELSLACQAKFLRVLEAGRFQRVGGTEELAVDVRVVAATHRDLEAMAKKGEFREDLLYRLGAMPIEIPPLRERREDIVLLADEFLAHFRERIGRRVTGFDPAAQEAIEKHEWPGNVRELKNAVERAVALGEEETIGLADLPASIRRSPAGEGGGEWPTLERIEEDYIRKVLEHSAGNKTRAARILGIERSTLYKKMRARASEGL